MHIKLGLTNNFVKAVKGNYEAFEHLKKKFSRITDAKLKEGVFVGPQIRHTTYELL